MNEVELQRMMVRLVGDGSSYQRMLKDASTATKETSGTLQVASRRVNALGISLRGYGMQMAAVGAGAVGVSQGFATALRAIDLAGTAERQEVAFQTMMRSADKGTQLMKDIQAMAASTPLNTADLVESSKMLQQFGIQGEKTIPIMRMLGDVTGGDAQLLLQMSRAFGQMASTGRLMGGDLFQMINAGFNPLEEISRKTGVSMAVLKQRMEKGQISVKMVIDAFKSATSAGGRFHNGMENASKTLKGLFSTLQDDVDASLREIGKSLIENLNLKEMTKEVSRLAQRFNEWFSSLDKGTKAAIFTFIGMLAVVALLTAAFFILKGVITAAFGGLNIIAAVVITSLVGAAAAGTALVMSLGGIAGAWAVIKKAALDAWEWLLPVRRALLSLWEQIQRSATLLWETIKTAAVNAWNSIAGGASVSWDEIRGYMLDAIIAAEFALANFEEVASVTWTAIQLGAVMFVDYFNYAFETLLPYTLEYFGRNWHQIFLDAFNLSTTLLQNMVQTYVNIFSNLPSLIAGKVRLSDLIVGPLDGFQSSLKEAFTPPEKEMSELEKAMREKLGGQLGALGNKFDAFRDKKLKEFMKPDQLQAALDGNKKAEASLDGIGAAATGVKDNVKAMDAALFGSAESIARITEYQEMLHKKPGDPNAVTGQALKSFDAVGFGSAAGGTRNEENTKILREIRDINKAQAKKPSVSVEPSSLG